MGFAGGVEFGDDGPHLRGRGGCLGVDLGDRVHLGGKVEYDRFVDGLAGEAGAAAAREHRESAFGTVGDHSRDVGGRFRENDANWGYLVGRGVGRVELPGVAIEPDLAVDAGLEVRHQSRPGDVVAPVIELAGCRGLRVRCHVSLLRVRGQKRTHCGRPR